MSHLDPTPEDFIAALRKTRDPNWTDVQHLLQLVWQGEVGATQQRIIDALAEDASKAAGLAVENERLRGWLSEIDMRGKQYDGEDMADLARDALAGKPLEPGMQR